MEIIIFGGSFNPPHNAHKKIADILSKNFDKVIIVPCGTRPDKPSANIIPIHHRMEMVKIAFNDIRNAIIDYYDIENNVYTPTYLLQERYEKLFPRDKIWHLIGEDIIVGGHDGISEIHKTWDFGPKIWQDLNFLIIVRPGYGAKAEDLPPNCKKLEIGNIIGSGTLVRKRLANNKPIDDLVESDIADHIKKNKLYDKKDCTKKGDEKLYYEIEILIGTFNEFKDKIYKYKSPEELFGALDGDCQEKN